MTLKTLALAAATLAIAVGTADAHEPYDDVFFVRSHATAADLFKDRADCRDTASHTNDTAAFYSNPQYGALSAMGSSLDEDNLHEGGLHKRLERVVFEACMTMKGWTLADVPPDEVKVLMRADARHPELLDAWLKTHEPLPAPPPQPASPVVKTAAQTSAPSQQGPR
jgi:hypothetical protein